MADRTPDPTDPPEPVDPDAHTNDALVAALNDAFETEPIPAALTRFAFDAFSWRLVDDELAEITFDSASTDLVGIRGTSTQRHTMQFEGAGLSVSVMLSDTSLVASIEPAGVHRCSIESPHGVTETSTDDDGEVVIDLPRLPLRIAIDTGVGRLVSPWITA